MDKNYFKKMVDRIYLDELKLKKANSAETEAPFLNFFMYLYLTVQHPLTFDKWDDFDFDIIVNFPFLDSDVSRRTSYGVYPS